MVALHYFGALGSRGDATPTMVGICEAADVNA
jgi:hypothetical protein